MAIASPVGRGDLRKGDVNECTPVWRPRTQRIEPGVSFCAPDPAGSAANPAEPAVNLSGSAVNLAEPAENPGGPAVDLAEPAVDPAELAVNPGGSAADLAGSAAGPGGSAPDSARPTPPASSAGRTRRSRPPRGGRWSCGTRRHAGRPPASRPAPGWPPRGCRSPRSCRTRPSGPDCGRGCPPRP